MIYGWGLTSVHKVNTKVVDVLESNPVDAVLCVAGGWAGGNATNPGQLDLCNLAC